MAENRSPDITTLTVQLLSAFVSKNEVSIDGLADLIKSTRAALMQELAEPSAAGEPEYAPAVSIRKSLSSPDHILSLIDGKPYRTLKRHLAANGLTEKEYRTRYNLPPSYPMVAPNYSQMRRAVAQNNGLGKKTGREIAASEKAVEAVAPLPSNIAEPLKRKNPTKPTSKKDSNKAAAGNPETASRRAASVEAKAARSPRKKLSMFRSNGSEETPTTVDAQSSAATQAPSIPSNAKPKTVANIPTRGKDMTKAKSAKSAIKAAGAHLGNETGKNNNQS